MSFCTFDVQHFWFSGHLIGHNYENIKKALICVPKMNFMGL